MGRVVEILVGDGLLQVVGNGVGVGAGKAVVFFAVEFGYLAVAARFKKAKLVQLVDVVVDQDRRVYAFEIVVIVVEDVVSEEYLFEERTVFLLLHSIGVEMPRSFEFVLGTESGDDIGRGHHDKVFMII